MTDIEIIDFLLSPRGISTVQTVKVTSREISAELTGPATKETVNRLLEMDREFYITNKGVLVIERN